MARINTAGSHLGFFPKSRWGKFVVGALALLGAAVGVAAGAQSGGSAGQMAAFGAMGAVGACLGSWVGVKITESIALDMARSVIGDSTITNAPGPS